MGKVNRIIVFCVAMVALFKSPNAEGIQTAFLCEDSVRVFEYVVVDGSPVLNSSAVNLKTDKRENSGFIEHGRTAQDSTFHNFPPQAMLYREYVWGLCISELVLTAQSNKFWPHYAISRIGQSKFVKHPLDATNRDQSLSIASDDQWGIADPQFGVAIGEDQLATNGQSIVCVDASAGILGGQYFRFGRIIENTPATARKCAVFIRPVGAQKCMLYAASEPAESSYSIWPASDSRQLHVFQLEIRDVADTRVDAEKLDKRHRWRGVWTRSASVDTPFVEPFLVAPGHVGDYLITATSGLWHLDWKAPNSEMRFIPLRGGELVQAVLYDVDRDNQAFAFTSSYWFEVKEPIEYHDFEFGSLKKEDLMPTLVRCAREARKHFPTVMKPEKSK